MLIRALPLLFFIKICFSYPGGAPESTCGDLYPKHHSTPAQDSPSPFTIQPAVQSLGSGRRMRLMLDSPQRVAFTGFMLQARSPQNPNEPIGVFTSVPDFARILECGGVSKNTVTHRDKTKKKSLEFEWEAPPDFEGTVYFNGTFVQDFSTFWANIPSPRIEVTKRAIPESDGGTAGISTTRSPLRTTVPNYTVRPPIQGSRVVQSIYDGCGVEKTCFGLPGGCLESMTCSSIVTVAPSTDKFVFELQGAKSNMKYIAVGLSSDQKMGEDSVAECVLEGSGVKLYTSHNDGRSNRRLADASFVQLVDASSRDGILYCKFTRNAISIVEGSDYDLVNEKYYLLLGSGGQLNADSSVRYHDIDFGPSARAINFSATQNIASASEILYRLHGAFMLAAWVGFASTGILLARYFKQTWVGGQMCGKDLWFVWHRTCMVSCWCLTVAGFVAIFVEIGGWYNETSNPHAVLGCVTTLLCFVQPLAAYFRPPPSASTRPIFYWSHWAIGNSALILSVVTMFFAVKLSKAKLPEWTDWILVALVVFYVVMHLLFSLLGCITDRKADKKVNTFPMKDMNSSRSPLHSPDRKRDAPNSCLRKFLLAIYLLVIICLTVILILIAVLAPIEDHPATKELFKLLNVSN